MSDYLRLFKVLYKNQNSASKDGNKKRRLPQWAAFMLSMLPIVLMISVGLVFAALQLKSIDALQGIMTSLMSGAQLFILFTGIASMFSTLYNAEDNAFLSALPIKPTSVFAAKFSMVYIDALKLAAVFLLPTLLAVSIAYAAAGNAFFYGFYPLIFLIIALTPLLPVFIVTLFSLPIMWLGSFLKGRQTLKSVLTLLFYVVLMGAYFVLIYWLNTGAVTEGVSDSALGVMNALSNVMYTDKSLMLLCLGVNAGVNFAIAFGSHAAMLALSALLAALFYKRITSKQLESKPEASKRAVSYKQKSIVKALVEKDFKSIIRNPTLAMSSLANVIIAPVVVVLMYFIYNKSGSAEGVELSNKFVAIGFVLMYGILFLGSSNQLSMLAFTRDGESFFATKALPVDAQSAIKAKLFIALAVPAACLVVIMVICLALFKLDIVTTLLLGLSIMLFCVGFNSLNIYLDIKGGNVNWKTPADLRLASKNNKAIVPVMLSILPAMLFLILGFVFAYTDTGIDAIALQAIYWGIVFVIAIAALFTGLYILINKGVPLYDKIGENKGKTVSDHISGKGLGGGFGSYHGGGKGGMLN
jgi:hypothetical protein